MKKVILLLSVVFTMTAHSQAISALKFESKVGNYGELKVGESATIEFVFTNVSDKPITIKNVKSNTSDINFKIKDKVVEPGQKSSIQVIYSTDEEGPIRKTISVYCSGEPSIYTLAIRGRVIKS